MLSVTRWGLGSSEVSSNIRQGSCHQDVASGCRPVVRSLPMASVSSCSCITQVCSHSSSSCHIGTRHTHSAEAEREAAGISREMADLGCFRPSAEQHHQQ